MLTYCSQDR